MIHISQSAMNALLVILALALIFVLLTMPETPIPALQPTQVDPEQATAEYGGQLLETQIVAITQNAAMMATHDANMLLLTATPQPDVIR